MAKLDISALRTILNTLQSFLLYIDFKNQDSDLTTKTEPASHTVFYAKDNVQRTSL